MPSEKRIRKRPSDVIRISSVMVMAWLAFACSRPAFPAEESTASTPQLQFAPVRLRPYLGGNINYTTRASNIAGTKARSQSLGVSVTAGADVNTFIWQPWFAQLSGGLGLNAFMSDSGYQSEGGSSSAKSTTSNVTGSAALDLVPLSRFPFRTYYDKIDNRQGFGFSSANTSTQTTRFGLNQGYRTLSGRTNSNARYEQNRWEGGFGEDRQKRFGFDINTALSANNNLSIYGDSTRSEHLTSNQTMQSNTLLANQRYRPKATVTVENLANLINTKYSLAQGDNVDTHVQLSNFTAWTLDERPLTITGGARLSGGSTSTPASTARQSSASGSLGATYQLSKQVRTFGNAGVNLDDDSTSGTQNMSSYESVGTDYRSDPTELGKYRYNTHAAGNISNSTVRNGSSQGVGVSAGHNLNRFSTESGGYSLDSHFDQTISASKVTRGEPSSTLSHSAAFAWAFAGEGGTTTVRFSGSDGRSVSGPRSFMQLVNLQANRTESMTRNSTLDGNLSIQASRSGVGNAPRSPTSITSSAGLNYGHLRIFGIPRLDFRSELRIYSDSLDPFAVGMDRHDSRSWNNSLNYSIGRLLLAADATFAQSNHVTQNILMFRLSRSF